MMGDLVTGLAYDLVLCQTNFLQKSCVGCNYREVIDVNDSDRVMYCVQNSFEKFVGAVQRAGAFDHTLFEGFIQFLELFVRLLYLGDGMLGEIDHNIYEDRATEKNSSGDQGNRKLKAAEQDEIEED